MHEFGKMNGHFKDVAMTVVFKGAGQLDPSGEFPEGSYEILQF